MAALRCWPFRVPTFQFAAKAEGRQDPQDPVRLICVGAVIPRKDYGFLLSSLKELNSKFQLDIIGDIADRNYRKTLDVQVSKISGLGQVNFTGTLTDRKLEEYYNGADFFLSSSTMEGYGMAIREAYAYGVPCLIREGSALTKDFLPRHVIVSRNLPSEFGKLLEDALFRPDYRTLKRAIVRDRQSLRSWSSTSNVFGQWLDAP